jgi:hypothetical protein
MRKRGSGEERLRFEKEDEDEVDWEEEGESDDARLLRSGRR